MVAEPQCGSATLTGDNAMRIEGRRILITGAASGIGLATARLFVQEGARVAMLDRNAAGITAAAAEFGDAATPVVADVAQQSQVETAVSTAEQALGGIDGVVNCAGIDLLRPFPEMTAADWRSIMAVDLDGPFFVCHAALPALTKAGAATIVNVASAAALRPLEHRTAYCSAKAAMVMFSKSLAVDLAPFNIRVNAICPGIIETPLFRQSYETAPDPQAELARIQDRYLIKRAGRPEEIAATALFLTSDESAYMTGSAIAVDGGRSFH
jgi:NAD(P)-dependent dehydrogenase (short-subunit alcohol dehydrogenase family)